MLKISLYHDFCVALHVHISMCAKLNDTLAVGGAASLRHAITRFLNVFLVYCIVNVPQDAAPPVTFYLLYKPNINIYLIWIFEFV